MLLSNLYKKAFIFRSKFKDKTQKEFFSIEKYKKFIHLYDRKYLAIQNFLFRIDNNLNKYIKFNSQILKVIIIFYSSKYFLNYKISKTNYKKKLYPKTINFLKFQNYSNEKIKLLTQEKDIIFKKFYIKKKSPKKLILIILLDGLNYKIINELKYSKNYFGKSISSNAWSNAEWTMPSYTNFITGNLTSTHKIHKPLSYYKNESEAHTLKDEKTIFNYFSSQGFVTGCYTGCVRINPTYKLSEYIDIFKHCDQEKGENLIEYAKGQIELFGDTSNFIFLHLNDGHHEMETGYKMSNFSYLNDVNYLNKKSSNNLYNEKYKSPFRMYRDIDKDAKMALYKDADLILNNLYSYLNSKKFDDYSIMLMGDHGQRMDFEEDQKYLLCNDMNNIGFAIKDKKIKRFNSKKMINTIDIFPSLVDRYPNKNFKKHFDGKNTIYGKHKRKQSVAESFYKNIVQVAVRDNKYHFHARKNYNEKKFEDMSTYKFINRSIKEIATSKNIKKRFLDQLNKYKKIII